MQSTAKKNLFSSLVPLLLFALLILFTLRISLLTEGIRAALRLCAYALIPTLFPFLVLTDLLITHAGAERLMMLLTKPVIRPLRLSKNGGVAFFLGAFFGFPMGARAVAHYYTSGAMTKEEAERLLLFSGNASPFFLIGGVGLGMMSSLRAGLYLYFLQLFFSFGCGLVLAHFAPPAKEKICATPISKEPLSVPSSIRGAVRSSLFITGYVLFFSALCSVVLPLLKSPFFSRLMAALLEIATACSLSTAKTDALTLPFCAFAVVFSGFSVFFQTQDCITKTDLKLKRYLPIKLLCGGLAFFITVLLSRFG